MGKIIDTGYFFNKGLQDFDMRNFQLARDSFEISKHKKEYRFKSNVMLSKIDMHEGKFKDARNRIFNYLSQDDERVMYLLASLESCEFNFDQSIRLLEQSFTKGFNDYKCNYQIARQLLNKGELTEARKLFKKCKENEGFLIASTYNLICIELMNGNISNAYRIFKNIDKQLLDNKDKKLYYDMILIFNYLFNVDLKGISIPKGNRYLKNILTTNDDKSLIDHISFHKVGAQKEILFFQDLNLKDLLVKARELIKTSRPNYSYLAKYYRFNLDTNIGEYNGKQVTGLSVITAPGTDIIVSVFPSDFSSEFDKEGYSKVLK